MAPTISCSSASSGAASSSPNGSSSRSSRTRARSCPAAPDELADFGRPKRISLCVLVDRGGRELPIQPDIVGKQVKVNSGERVDVLVEELDRRDEVALVRQGATA